MLCVLLGQQHLTGADNAFRDLKAMGDGTDGGVLLCWGGRVLRESVVMEQMGVWHDDWFLRLLLRLYRMGQ